MNQERCRKQWLQSAQQCDELTARCNELQYDNDALTTKLKHARSDTLISHHVSSRYIVCCCSKEKVKRKVYLLMELHLRAME